jgi:hypothetical protein
MSTISTDGLGLGMELLTPGPRPARNGGVPPRSDVSTATLEIPADGATASCRLYPIRWVLDAVESVFDKVFPTERSRGIDPARSVVIGRPPEKEWPVADFFEPITFEFDPDIEDARAAARRYSEQTYADY